MNIICFTKLHHKTLKYIVGKLTRVGNMINDEFADEESISFLDGGGE